MKPRLRWFQYSLRSSLILLTALAVWLGVVVNRAREQREVVKAIEATGGFVLYDWQFDAPSPSGQPSGPVWLQRFIGKEFFQEIETVAFLGGRSHPSEPQLLRFIPRLQRLRRLKTLLLWPSISENVANAFKTAFPTVLILRLGSPRETRLPIYRPGFAPSPSHGTLSTVIDIVKAFRREMERKNAIDVGP